jgi:hypothetical protein
LGLFFGGQAVVADAAYFGAGDGDEEVAVAGDLVFELIVEMAFEFADFAAPQAGDMDVIARPVGFVVMAVTAEMEQVEFVDEAVFLQKINGAVDSDQVDVFVQLLGAFEDLVNIEVLLSIVHNLEDDATLTGETDSALAQSLLEMSGGLGGVEAFAGRDSMRWGRGHDDWTLAVNAADG